MPNPIFLLQIVHNVPPYEVVRFPGGSALERDFVLACTDAICQRGVGVLKSEAQVRQAIAAGIGDTITALKKDTKALVS